MTPHVSRKSSARVTKRAAALAAAAAMVVVGVQAGAGTATAAPEKAQAPSASAAAAAVRANDIKSAQADAASVARALGLGAGEKLIVRDVIKDADGTVHTRYDRTFDGLPVLGGDLVTHVAKGGKLKSIDKATDAKISVPTTTPKLKSAAGARKVIFAVSGKPTLAFETVKSSVKKDGTPSRLHTITDAATGKTLYSFDEIDDGFKAGKAPKAPAKGGSGVKLKAGSGASMYSGEVALTTTKGGSGFELTDGERGGHKTYDLKGGQSGTGTLFTDADDKWGNGKADDAQTAAVDAAYGAAMTWDFYKAELGRNGIAGDGKAAYSRVHYGKAYVNAFWDDSCFCMTYGDGIGNTHPLTAIDVAGHEMSHGLTAATANLEYAGESGGLNEATSDILGTAVEFFAKNTTDVGDYLIGEKIDINGDGSPLRYMDKPSKDGQSLDYWDEKAGDVDVHYSSGIANHFFYLLAEGSGAKEINGVKYDSPTKDGSKVTGIGQEKAYKIWYKALSTYMTSTTDYKAAREATLKAATDLYGADGVEAKTVAAAWTGVNVK
ncbi:M4 family metallopeptidase [Streptomyces sp. NPDC004111]|uniref:M4 family metallopeptidase n=1 Tax=Streptomyces sp. NPDC004111 TaxID=3364690 RepID=UPI0036BB067A